MSIEPNSAPDVVQQELAPPSMNGARFRTIMLAVLTTIMIGLCIYLAVPFIPALIWGIALVVIAWPLHARISRSIKFPSVAAGVSTAVVVGIVLVPAIFVSYHIASEAGNAAANGANSDYTENMVRHAMAGLPVLDDVAAWMDRVGVDLNREVRKLIESRTRDTAALVQGSLTAGIQFLVMLFVMFYLFRDRDYLLRNVRGLLPLDKAEGDRVFTSIENSVHANLRATVIAASVNGISAGLVFWAVGLPSPVLWGAVILVLSIVPVLGTILVWIPAAIYMAIQGRWPNAAGIVCWGIASAILVDNLLFIQLAGDRMRMHKLPTLLAYIGGLAVFGMSGLVLGPAILAVTKALLIVWHQRASDNSLSTAVTVSGGNEKPHHQPGTYQEASHGKAEEGRSATKSTRARPAL